MSKREPMPGLISRAEACRRLRRSRKAIDQLVADGELIGTVVGAYTFIVERSLSDYQTRLLNPSK